MKLSQRLRHRPHVHALGRVYALGLALLLPMLACSSDGGSPTEASPGPSTVTVEVHDFHFEPRSIQVQPGTTVRWVFEGSEPGHTVTDRGGAFDSGFVFQQPGNVFQFTFTEQHNGRTFEYWCVSHEECCGMKGSVRVGANAPEPSPGY